MEEIKKQSSIKIEDRNVCHLEGVKKLDSFDDKEFLVDTNLGFLHITGKKLSLETMDMDNGLLTIKGEIDSLKYMNKSASKEKEGNFFKKLFK